MAMKNTNLSEEGKHAYDKNNALEWLSVSHPDTKSFSVGIFKWVLSANKRYLKPSKAVVRVIGSAKEPVKIFNTADLLIRRLDEGTWNGQKTLKC